MPAQSTHVAVPAGVQSPRAKLVFLVLVASGATAVEERQGALVMTKPPLDSVLRTLTERGVVEEEGVDMRSVRISWRAGFPDVRPVADHVFTTRADAGVLDTVGREDASIRGGDERTAVLALRHNVTEI
jgi:hypothetical protein